MNRCFRASRQITQSQERLERLLWPISASTVVLNRWTIKLVQMKWFCNFINSLGLGRDVLTLCHGSMEREKIVRWKLLQKSAEKRVWWNNYRSDHVGDLNKSFDTVAVDRPAQNNSRERNHAINYRAALFCVRTFSPPVQLFLFAIFRSHRSDSIDIIAALRSPPLTFAGFYIFFFEKETGREICNVLTSSYVNINQTNWSIFPHSLFSSVLDK